MVLDQVKFSDQLGGMSAEELHESVVALRSAQCDYTCPHCGMCIRVERGEWCLYHEIADEAVVAAAEEQVNR